MASKVSVSWIPYMPAFSIERRTRNPPVIGRANPPVIGRAMLRVEAPQVVVEDGCLPVDLVAVLDISSSMGWAAAPALIGGESRLDVVKRAMKFVISELRDDKDRLAIVPFNHKVVECTNEFIEISRLGRVSAETTVDKLMAKGGTAFKPALLHAVKILDDRVDKSRVGFIILVSDGIDNSKFKRDGFTKYPVHTFGLGKAHDPEVLHLLAKESKGTYYSINDNLNSKIMEAFTVCLGGLKTVVAIDTRVDIRQVNNNGLWRTQVTRIDSGGYNCTISDDSTSRTIQIGILCADEVKDFIVHYKLRIAELDDEINLRECIPLIADSQYSLPDRSRMTNNSPGNEAIPIIDTLSLSVPLYSLPDHSRMTKDLVPSANVLQRMVRLNILKLLIAFLEEFQALKKEVKGAADRGIEDKPDLETMAGDTLLSMWEDFKKSDKSWKEAKRIGLDLGGMTKDITAMVRNMKQASDVACVYSWVSSYQMQHATTTGLPSTTAFLTNSMKEMMKTARKKSEEDATSSNVQGQANAPGAPPA